jgi:cell wall-associated NlpC family hydrolase
MRYTVNSAIISLLLACHQPTDHNVNNAAAADNINSSIDTPQVEKKNAVIGATVNYNYSSSEINTGNTTPQELLSFANTLIGTPYKYASIDPAVGFDCSGFITYVFSHFKIAVPRSSIDFTNVRRTIPLEKAKPGDLILFTGTDSTIHQVGHMGIIASAQPNDIKFIHSTSGKANGVTITPLNAYYMSRFVKIIRVFKQNDE